MKLGITGSRSITEFDFIPYFTMQNRDFRAFCRNHGIRIGNSEKTLGICYAGSEEASLLSVSEGEALIQMRDLVYSMEGKPIFCGKEIVDSGRFDYRIHQEA